MFHNARVPPTTITSQVVSFCLSGIRFSSCSRVTRTSMQQPTNTAFGRRDAALLFAVGHCKFRISPDCHPSPDRAEDWAHCDAAMVCCPLATFLQDHQLRSGRRATPVLDSPYLYIDGTGVLVLALQGPLCASF